MCHAPAYATVATNTTTQQGVTLKGSIKTVVEFFEYSVNNILYQREIYPPESFRRVPKYGLAMFVTTDDGLNGYLSQVLAKLQGEPARARVARALASQQPVEPASLWMPAEWLESSAVQKLVLVIISAGTVSLNVSEADAIVWAGYGGEEAGNGLVDALTGQNNRWGKMATTTYAMDYEKHVGPLTDFSMTSGVGTETQFFFPISSWKR